MIPRPPMPHVLPHHCRGRLLGAAFLVGAATKQGAVPLSRGALAHDGAAAGLATALAAPLLATLGVVLWDKHWRGSVLLLNLLKACLATPLFFIAAAAGSGAGWAALGPTAALALAASAFLGVVLGDSAWLHSIRLLGTRRVILVDSIRPFVAVLFGGLVFHESASLATLLSIGCTVLGVLVVSLERTPADLTAPAAPRAKLAGLALALASVVLDVLGMVLTKRFGVGLGPWLIGGLRFGFAALCQGLLLLLVLGRRRASGAVEDVEKGAEGRASVAGMDRGAWARVCLGCVLVTFLSPACGNHALFALPLGLCLTLGSTGPVFVLPLLWLFKGERASRRAAAGSALAVLGVAAFCRAAGLR